MWLDNDTCDGKEKVVDTDEDLSDDEETANNQPTNPAQTPTAEGQDEYTSPSAVNEIEHQPNSNASVSQSQDAMEHRSMDEAIDAIQDHVFAPDKEFNDFMASVT